MTRARRRRARGRGPHRARPLLPGRGDGRGDHRERCPPRRSAASSRRSPRRTRAGREACLALATILPPGSAAGAARRARAAAPGRAGPPSPACRAPARPPRGRPRPIDAPDQQQVVITVAKERGRLSPLVVLVDLDELGGGVKDAFFLPDMVEPRLRRELLAPMEEVGLAERPGGPARGDRARSGRPRPHRRDRLAHPLAAAPAGARPHRAVAGAAAARRHRPAARRGPDQAARPPLSGGAPPGPGRRAGAGGTRPGRRAARRARRAPAARPTSSGAAASGGDGGRHGEAGARGRARPSARSPSPPTARSGRGPGPSAPRASDVPGRPGDQRRQRQPAIHHSTAASLVGGLSLAAGRRFPAPSGTLQRHGIRRLCDNVAHGR